MTKITDMINELKEPEMDENIFDNIEMTKEEKERTATRTLNKIRAEKANGFDRTSESVGTSTSSGVVHLGRRFSRKFVVLVAALVLVLGFGVVAYASAWFEFGKVDDYLGWTETASLKDSNQFKAMKEYQDYYNGLSEEKQWELFEEYKTEFIRLNKTYEGKGFPVVYTSMNKVKELCEKYDLKLETEELITKNVDEAFEKANVNNFLGKFQVNIDRGEGQYSYSDQGAVSIIADIENYCDIDVTPNDVFRHITLRHVAYKDNKTFKEWDYETKDGHFVKCDMYEEKIESDDEATEEIYNFTAPVGNYVVTFTMIDSNKDGKRTHSKEGLEKIIEQFDFAKLE